MTALFWWGWRVVVRPLSARVTKSLSASQCPWTCLCHKEQSLSGWLSGVPRRRWRFSRDTRYKVLSLLFFPFVYMLVLCRCCADSFSTWTLTLLGTRVLFGFLINYCSSVTTNWTLLQVKTNESHSANTLEKWRHFFSRMLRDGSRWLALLFQAINSNWSRVHR